MVERQNVIAPPEFAYRLPEVCQAEAITVTISFPADWLRLIQEVADSKRAQGDAIWFGQIMQKIAIAHARDEHQNTALSAAKRADQ